MTDPVVQQPVTVCLRYYQRANDQIVARGGYCDDSCLAQPHPFYSVLAWTEYYILDVY